MSRYFLILLISCTILIIPAEAQNQNTIQPNLKPGRVYNIKEVPESWFNFVFPSRTIWGENAVICWESFTPETSFGAEVGSLQSDECLIYVLKGPVTLNPGESKTVLHETDCFFLEKGNNCVLSSGFDSAELLVIQWPVIPMFVSMKFWQEKTLPPASISPSSAPSVPPGKVIRLRELGMSDIAKNVRGRFVQGKRGQICDLVYAPNAVFSPREATEEEYLYVLQGTLNKTINNETVSMKEGDVMYIPAGMVHGSKAGPYGCRIMALITPSRNEYAETYKKQSEKINKLVYPGAKPEVVIDGATTEPKITNLAEGPSWIHGKLFFSNQSAGIYVVDSDGSCKLITKDIETCGTTPLNNGNLAVCDLSQKRILEVSPEGKIIKTLADSARGLPAGNPNDIISDAKGGLYVTVNDFTGMLKQTNVVVYISSQGNLTRLINYNDIDFPNGIALSSDGSKLFIGSNETVVWMFDVHADGTISNKRPYAYINLAEKQIGRADAKSFADGMEIDSRGNLYITSQAGIQVFDNTGGYIGTIQIPSFISNLAFGGEDLKTLYITASGKVYSLKMNVPGLRYPLR